jgi:tRNA dimethylallyltransferase
LEVFTATGRPLSAFHDSRSGAVLNIADCVAVFLEPDREVLRQRIDARFDAMMAMGAGEEVEALMLRGLDPALPAMRAHGVPGLIRALRNEISVEEAVAIGKADTRRYAKRQHTWFRHQAPEFAWVRVEEAEGRISELMLQEG